MYCYIIPFGKTFDNIGFTYSIPAKLIDNVKLWQVLEIPFANNAIFWVVYKKFDKLEWNLKAENIKDILSIKNDVQIIDSYRINLLKFISDNYLTPIHNSLNLFIPKNLKEKIIKEKIDFDKTNKYSYNYDLSIHLTTKQEEVYENIKYSDNNKILFFGITWSGKTEIYIKLIKDYLDKWEQSLLLVPEIILSNQLASKIKNVFWNDVLVINSTVTDAVKTKYFLDIKSGNAKIIIWTRSSLFYPYSNLWLIIIDEEHDNSYSSDQSPRYNWIEIANKITDLNGNKLVLASWTPSVDSMYKWVKWSYELINLLEKYKK